MADLRGITADPLTAQYLSHRAIPLIEVPLDFCRGLQPVGFDFSDAHPFVRTAGILRDRALDYSASPLAEYFQAFQPASACAVLGLPRQPSTAALQTLEPAVTVLPWWSDQLIDRLADREARKRAIEADYRRAGLQLTGVDHGSTWFGPMSNDQGVLEIQRISRLIDSIGTQGLQRNDTPDGDITGCFLVDDQGHFRVMLHRGQHRAAVAAALGLMDIPVRMYSPVSACLVRRSEVAHWPHVRSGLFSAADALRVFDRIFAGIPSCDPSVQTGQVAQER